MGLGKTIQSIAFILTNPSHLNRKRQKTSEKSDKATSDRRAPCFDEAMGIGDRRKIEKTHKLRVLISIKHGTGDEPSSARTSRKL